MSGGVWARAKGSRAAHTPRRGFVPFERGHLCARNAASSSVSGISKPRPKWDFFREVHPVRRIAKEFFIRNHNRVFTNNDLRHQIVTPNRHTKWSQRAVGMPPLCCVLGCGHAGEFGVTEAQMEYSRDHHARRRGNFGRVDLSFDCTRSSHVCSHHSFDVMKAHLSRMRGEQSHREEEADVAR